MAGRGQGPDFVEALARGLDVLRTFDAAHPRMSLTEIANGQRPRPPHRPPAAAHARGDRLRTRGRRPIRADPAGASAGHVLHQLARALGHRPAPPRAARLADARVVLDGAAGRLGHRLRRPRGRAQDHLLAGRRRHPLPRHPDVAGQGAAGGARAGRARPPSWPSRAAPDCRRSPSARPAPSTATCVRYGPAAGRSPTRSWPRASALWRFRSATATALVRAAMNVTVHAAETTLDTLVSQHLPRLIRTVRGRLGGVGTLADQTVDGGRRRVSQANRRA